MEPEMSIKIGTLTHSAAAVGLAVLIIAAAIYFGPPAVSNVVSV